VLKEAMRRAKVSESCAGGRDLDADFYIWRKQVWGLEIRELRFAAGGRRESAVCRRLWPPRARSAGAKEVRQKTDTARGLHDEAKMVSACNRHARFLAASRVRVLEDHATRPEARADTGSQPDLRNRRETWRRAPAAGLSALTNWLRREGWQ